MYGRWAGKIVIILCHLPGQEIENSHMPQMWNTATIQVEAWVLIFMHIWGLILLQFETINVVTFDSTPEQSVHHICHATSHFNRLVNSEKITPLVGYWRHGNRFPAQRPCYRTEIDQNELPPFFREDSQPQNRTCFQIVGLQNRRTVMYHGLASFVWCKLSFLGQCNVLRHWHLSPLTLLSSPPPKE